MMPRHRARPLVPVLLALAVVLGACGGGGESPAPDAGSETPTTTAGGGSAGGDTAGMAGVPDLLDVGAAAVGGARVEFGDYHGEQLALWFWAPW